MDGRPVQKLLSGLEELPISVMGWTSDELNKVVNTLSGLTACKVGEILKVIVEYAPEVIKRIDEVPKVVFVAAVTSDNKKAFDLLYATHTKEFRRETDTLLEICVLLNRADMIRDIVDKCRLDWSADIRQLLCLAKSLGHEPCVEVFRGLRDKGGKPAEETPMEDSLITTQGTGKKNASWTVFQPRHDVTDVKEAPRTKHSSWLTFQPPQDPDFAGVDGQMNPFITIMNNDRWLSEAVYAGDHPEGEMAFVTLMKRLCANRVDPNCVEKRDFSQPWHSNTVLHWVIDSCYCNDLLLPILEAGADFNSDDAYGYPPLSKAAYILNDFDKFCEILKYNPIVEDKVLTTAATSDLYIATATVHGVKQSSFLLMLLDCGYRGGSNYTLVSEIENAFESFRDSQLAIKDTVLKHTNQPKPLKIICRLTLQSKFAGLSYTKFVNNLSGFPARLKNFLLFRDEMSDPRCIGDWLEIEKMSPFTLFA